MTGPWWSSIFDDWNDLMKRAFVVAVAALLISGCAAYKLVEPKTVTVADVLIVEPHIAWSSITTGPWEVWTVDGTSLQALQFLKGLAHDEPLFSRGSDKRPRFRKDMTPYDVMDFVVDSLADAGGQQIQAARLRPASFAGVDGFRFDWTLWTKQGLEKRGFAVGAIVNEKLYLAMYTGTTDYYYEKHAGDAERVIQSARMK
jgi:hypothetical protein